MEVLIFLFHLRHLFLAPLIQLLCADLSFSIVLCRGSDLFLKITFCYYRSLCRFLLVFTSRNADIKEKYTFESSEQPQPTFKIS